ncbi:TerD family protein [Streptomyces fructofermentans]|uniref:TerD family protein n=1 Tax=Streptomyces fructofermentans TaxID=152141 RepID=UPI001E3E2ABB|nr:TerD family protein [Streptomyces fructofermentans]
MTPSAAQLERARRQAERAQQDAERDAAIAQLRELRRRTTSVHLQSFPAAHPPAIPGLPQLGMPWALAEAQAFHLRGVGWLARGDRAAAKHCAEQDAARYLAEETARLHAVHERMRMEAGQWWRALLANDEETVCEAVNTAFSDNPAAGCAVGMDGAVLSVVMRAQDLDAMPAQTAGLTPSGRPTLKNLTKRDRVLWWLTSMGSNIVATLMEGFATAPNITGIDLAVLTRLPDTQRLGFVAYGRWSRQSIESTSWREPEDALRFLDIGQDVACSVTTTASGTFSSTIKPLDATRVPGLQELLDHAQDEPDDRESAASLAGLDRTLGAGITPDDRTTVDDPYRIKPFAEWKHGAAPQPPPASAPVTPAASATELVPGQNLVLPDDALHGLGIAFRFAGADADLSLFLLGDNGRVTADEDFVFYNQPSTTDGAARLAEKQQEGPHTVERATIHLSVLPERVRRVAIAINMDVDTGLTCGSLSYAVWDMECVTGTAWTFRPPADPSIRAMVIAELYRHAIEGRSVWKLRALGQGWAEGLDGLARAHGIDVE